jgi:hypothetical protein
MQSKKTSGSKGAGKTKNADLRNGVHGSLTVDSIDADRCGRRRGGDPGPRDLQMGAAVQ